MDNPFAQVSDDRETIVAQVVRDIAEEWQTSPLPLQELDPCVRVAVDTLWKSEVKTFVPLLALRRVRTCIRAGSCMTAEW